MKKLNLIGPGAILAGTLMSATTVQAEGYSFLPFMQDGYEFKPTLSVTGGQLDPDVSGVDTASTFGIELSFTCPLLATPTNGIRQQLSITSSDKDGLEMTSYELNPHYVIGLNPNFGIGFGPGIGLLNVDYGGDSDTVFTGQLGASMHYRTGAVYLGLEARQQFTADVDMLDDDANNTRLSFKLGVDF